MDPLHQRILDRFASLTEMINTAQRELEQFKLECRAYVQSSTVAPAATVDKSTSTDPVADMDPLHQRILDQLASVTEIYNTTQRGLEQLKLKYLAYVQSSTVAPAATVDQSTSTDPVADMVPLQQRILDQLASVTEIYNTAQRELEQIKLKYRAYVQSSTVSPAATVDKSTSKDPVADQLYPNQSDVPTDGGGGAGGSEASTSNPDSHPPHSIQQHEPESNPELLDEVKREIEEENEMVAPQQDISNSLADSQQQFGGDYLEQNPQVDGCVGDDGYGDDGVNPREQQPDQARLNSVDSRNPEDYIRVDGQLLERRLE